MSFAISRGMLPWMSLRRAGPGTNRLLFVFAASLFLCLLPQIASTSPGDLDPTFGAGGKVTTDFKGSYDNGFAAALQSDGKMLVVGESFLGTIVNDLALARYNSEVFINLCAKTGSATLDVTASGRSLTITDSTTADDTCSCGAP